MLDIHNEPEDIEPKDCTAVTYQSAIISVPVTINPKIKTGDISTFCCGEPKIIPLRYNISRKHGSSNFILTQEICIEIPLEFSANVSAADPRVEYEDITEKYVKNADDKNIN